MMKKKLGRGLSSLFSIYDNNDAQQENENKKAQSNTMQFEEPVKKPKIKEEPEVNSTDDVLKNARSLLDSLNKKENTIEIVDTDETVENDDYVAKRNRVSEKLKANAQSVISDNGIKSLPLSKIEPNPDQPRKNFDPDSLKELAQSIQIHGVIQPIVVCPKGDDKYVIIAGERRYRACKMLKMETIPVIIKRYTEQEMKEIALIENLQRDDLNPIETAYAMKQLVDNFGFSQEALAKRLGISRPTITNTIRLLSLCPQVMALVEQGKIAPNTARVLVNIEDEELQFSLARKAIAEQMSTRDVEKMVKEILNPKQLKPKPSVKTIPELMQLRDLMQHTFSTKVNVIGNDKKGRIYIDYYSRDDLDRISTILNKVDKGF